MKVLILNSGLGCRMGALTSDYPKCMSEISESDTILSRQLKLIESVGIRDIVITTGYFDQVLIDYCKSLNFDLDYTFVKNPIYDTTNYIYSIYCAKKELEDEDIILMHGDLVFESEVLDKVLECKTSCMTVSSTLSLPEKDFKAVVYNGKIEKVGVEFFDNALAAQPLYKLTKKDWKIWLDKISEFCEIGDMKCYAEKALNEISSKIDLNILDVKNKLCAEIDNFEDLKKIKIKLQNMGKFLS